MDTSKWENTLLQQKVINSGHDTSETSLRKLLGEEALPQRVPAVLSIKVKFWRTSLVVQWLGICLVMQDSVPGRGTKIPQAMELLSLGGSTTEPHY